EETPSVWQRLGAWIARERRRRATVRELSAMSDELLADVGIERAEIPAVADALVDGQPIAPVAGEPVTATAPDLPGAAQARAYVAVRSAAQREANQTHADRPAAGGGRQPEKLVSLQAKPRDGPDRQAGGARRRFQTGGAAVLILA